MLIERIHKDMMSARQSNTDPVLKNLLIAFYSEALRIGKDKRNGQSTDDEVISVGKKFITNASETAKILKDRGQDDSVQQKEISIIANYLPKQSSEDELKLIIASIINESNLSGTKAMGQIMSSLKSKYGNAFDGKLASGIAKSILTIQ